MSRPAASTLDAGRAAFATAAFAGPGPGVPGSLLGAAHGIERGAERGAERGLDAAWRGHARVAWDVVIAGASSPVSGAIAATPPGVPGRVTISMTLEGAGPRGRVVHVRAEVVGAGSSASVLADEACDGRVVVENGLCSIDLPGVAACVLRCGSARAGDESEPVTAGRALYAQTDFLQRAGVLAGCAEPPTGVVTLRAG